MKLILTLSLIFVTALVYSQEEKNNTIYTRIGLNEPSIGYERKINSTFSLGFEAGYRFRFTDEAHVPYGVLGYPIQSFITAKAYKGLFLRPIILNFENDKGNTHSISTSYHFLSADKLIYDPGKFGGSNTSDYAVYSDQRHQIGVSYLFNKAFSKVPALSFFLETGIKYSFYERQYSIEGSFSSQIPSNRQQSGTSIGIIANFGLKINLVKM